MIPNKHHGKKARNYHKRWCQRFIWPDYEDWCLTSDWKGKTVRTFRFRIFGDFSRNFMQNRLTGR